MNAGPRHFTTALMLAGAVLTAGLGSAAQAATVSVTSDDTTPFSTTAIAAFDTTGADMDGMLITGAFAGLPGETLRFGVAGGDSGATEPGSFLITQGGDTYTGPFEVSVTGAGVLTALTFAGGPGDTVFDTVPTAEVSTGSAMGSLFMEMSALSGAIGVTFSNPVAVEPDAPAGDLYETMSLDLSGLDGGGLVAGQILSFLQDTDTLQNPGDIRPLVVPVPASGWILLGGIVALWIAGRKRMQRRAL